MFRNHMDIILLVLKDIIDVRDSFQICDCCITHEIKDVINELKCKINRSIGDVLYQYFIAMCEKRYTNNF